MENKQKLRARYRKIRKNISVGRKIPAENSALEFIDQLMGKNEIILSYANFGDEFNTENINRLIALKGKLALPKITGNSLTIYLVDDPQRQTAIQENGMREPIPTLCKEIDPEMIGSALIPAIAFDRNGHRIGYGKGFYDRFLAGKNISTYGIGFKEQLTAECIPVTPEDLSVKALALF